MIRIFGGTFVLTFINTTNTFYKGYELQTPFLAVFQRYCLEK